MKLVNALCPLLFALMLKTPLQAQLSPNARVSGIGGAGVALAGIESVFTNPASKLPAKGQGYIATSSLPFAIPELTYAGIGTKISIDDRQWISAHLTNFGIGKYRRSMIALGYARNVLESLSIALEMSGKSEYFEGYGTAHAAGYGVFLFQHISGKTDLGIALRNIVPIPSKLNTIPSFSAGISHRPRPILRLYADISKQQYARLRFMAGTEYLPSEVITLRFGIATRPATFHAGATVRCSSRLSLSMAMSYHIILGLSPSFDITFTP